MTGSIGRLRRWMQVPAASLLVAVAVVGPTKDPVRRVTGYGGVLLVPRKAHSTLPAHDPLLEQKRDARAARGRVLYSPGHVPAAADTHAVRAPRHTPCPERSVAQARATAALPNS
ncbi:MAG TPA: hypothetical protein VHB25_21650 [Gemmatimonadaceae bacterium]|nr:hypothetical protein [Gemmatimonadaceae bacterium]